MSLTNSECPPNDSKAMGINWTPMLTHCWEYCSNFLSSAAFRAKPDFLAAFEITLGCSDEVMVISRAAGCPADQQRKYTSPGREFVSGIRFFCSQTSEKIGNAASGKNGPLGGHVAKSYRSAHDIQQHDHRVYPKILFYNRDTSFLFHIWERPVCTSQLHKTRSAGDVGREPVWELPITMLLIEAERDNKRAFSLSDV